jgi:hypothetical protein
LALALDLPSPRSALYVTDALATNGAYSRRRAICDDCKREKLVTMAD